MEVLDMNLTRKHIKHKTWGLFDKDGRRFVIGSALFREHPIHGALHIGKPRFYGEKGE
jgi:hypothetical protein